MSTRLRTSPAQIILLVLVTAATVSAGPFERSFHRTLAEAMKASSKEDADKKIDEARKMLSRRVSTDKLEREFLEADLLRAHGRAYALLAQKDTKRMVALTHAGRDMLTRAFARYTNLDKQCTADATRMAEEAVKAKKEKTLERSPKYRRLNASSWRAKYRMAWVQYRLAQLAHPRIEKASREQWLTQAAGLFNEFTTMGEGETPMSDIVLDCFLGEALCYKELAAHEKVIDCVIERLQAIEMVRKAVQQSARRPVFARLFHVLLEAYAERGDRRGLETAAERYFTALPVGSTYSPIERDMAFRRAENLHRLVKSGSATREQQRALGRVTRTLDGYGDPWCTKLDELLGRNPLTTSHGRTREAAQHFRAQEYQKAIQLADKAISEYPSAPGTADAREIKAAAYWNLKQWPEAHKAAFDFVDHHPKDPRAEMWCRRTFQAGLKAQKATPPIDVERLLNAFDTVARKRPGDAETLKLQWYRGYVLIEAGEYARAYRSLMRVRNPENPVYRQAQYGIALSCWKQAETALRAKETRRAADDLARAAAAVKRFLDAPAPKGKPDDKENQRLNDAVAYLGNQVVRGLLDLPTPHHEQALALLDKLERSARVTDDRADQRRTLRIEAECLEKGPAGAAVHINDHITDKADAPVAQAAANVVSRLEKEYDRLIAVGKKTEAEALAWRILRIHEFLYNHVRNDERATARMKGDIRGRLAHAYLRLGKGEKAIPHFENALGQSPRAADLLRGLAVAFETTGRYDRAVAQWRMLARGLDRGSDGWFEAHYRRMTCYAKMNRLDQARKLLHYYLAYLHPDDAPEAWSGKFKRLEVELREKETPARAAP